jgi:uncharacterized protein DUF4279
MYLSQSYVYISLYGDKFSPTEFTQLVNSKPTDFGVKGDKRKSGAILKECFWKFQLNKTDALEGLEESLESLASIFRDKIPVIKDFIQKNDLKVKCYVVIESKNNEDNGVSLNADFISFLNELEASFEMYVYNA